MRKTDVEGMNIFGETRDEVIVRLQKERAELIAALRGILIGPSGMEEMLWGDQPDTATVSSKYPLGALRKALAILAKAESSSC